MPFATYDSNIIQYPKKRAGKLNSYSTPLINYADSIDDATGWQDLITPLAAEGSFISARITRVGGSRNRKDLTTIKLLLSNKSVVKMSFEHAYYMGLTQNNPYGIAFFSRKKRHKCDKRVETLTIGFPQPLFFSQMKLQTHISDKSVERIFAEVIYSSSSNSGDSDAGGGRIEE